MPPKRRRSKATETGQPSSSADKDTQPSQAVTRAAAAARQTPIYPPPIPIAASPSTQTPLATATATATAATATVASVPPTSTPVPLPRIPGQAPPSPSHTPRPRPKAKAKVRAKASKPGQWTATAQLTSPSVSQPHPPQTGLRAPATNAAASAAHSTLVMMEVDSKRARPAAFSVIPPEVPQNLTLAAPQQGQKVPLSARVSRRAQSPAASRTELTPNLSAATPTSAAAPTKQPAFAVANKSPSSADRNIDKVVLGDLCFKTWYPSYYGKELLGDSTPGSNAKNGGGGSSSSKDHGSELGKAHGYGKREREHPVMLERLYVCPSCFKYAKELVVWWGHVRSCELRGSVPGKRVYVHPRGQRRIRVAHEGKGPGPKKRRGDGGVRYTEHLVQDEGEWSIWEVDGEVDGLFCQNLSLFAKLFLDNKSVFFDVAGFNYFLLVYTPPPPKQPPAAAGTDDAPEEAPPPFPQVTGFFSKEKMSWDNNNLACILVFPPWQRKGLGALLMGASYEISRREGIIGGPEKPISDLGRRGYRRFWSGEIARWLLGLKVPTLSVPSPQPPQLPLPPQLPSGMECIVDVHDCSRATWISPEDCLGVLRDMGVLEDAGVGPGKPVEKQRRDMDDVAADEDASYEVVSTLAVGEGGGGGVDGSRKQRKISHSVLHTETLAPAPALDPASASTLPPPPPPPASSLSSPPKSPLAVSEMGRLVPRVRIDKEQIRRYVALHRISLERTCDPLGFTEGYAVSADRELAN